MRLLIVLFFIVSINAQSINGIDQFNHNNCDVDQNNNIKLTFNRKISSRIHMALNTVPVKSIQINSENSLSNVNKKYNPQKYQTELNIGMYGLISVASLTILGSGLMKDQMFETTAIPVVGPLITIIRIENSSSSSYVPGGKTLLITSGLLQISFLSYWIYYLIQDSKYKSENELTIIPNIKNVGFTFSYKF